MKKQIMTLGFLTLAMILTQACATTSLNSEVDNKMKEEAKISTAADLRAEGANLIENDPTLKPEQKSQLSALRLETEARLKDINSRSLELRSLLLKDVLATNYNADEVNLVENRLSKVEQERLDTIFKAVAKTNRILGHQAGNYGPYFQRYIDREGVFYR